MKTVAPILFLALAATTISAQQPAASVVEPPVLVADRLFWAGPEGNAAAEITGKFQSEEKLQQHFQLSNPIGTFTSKQKPPRLVQWTLREILVSVDFNGGGSVATWRVSGPKPLVLAYVERLKTQFDDKSQFYDFGIRLLKTEVSVN